MPHNPMTPPWVTLLLSGWPRLKANKTTPIKHDIQETQRLPSKEQGKTLDPSVGKVKLLTTQHLTHKMKCINYLGGRIFKNLTFHHILKDN